MSAVASLPDRYWAALAAGDRRGAVRLALESLEAGSSVERTLAELVCPAQVEVGRRWAGNEWNVAQEHIATSISEEVVAALAATSDLAARTPVGTAVVCCVEGEWHALPARVLAETLRVNGWDVHYLGASLPAQHLAQYVHDVGPDVIGLSCSVSTSLPHARHMIEASRGAAVPVVAGGRGFGSDGRWARALGATGWAPTATDAARLLSEPTWPRYSDPAPPLRHPDDAAEHLRAAAHDLAQQAMVRLEARFPAMRQYPATALERTREDLEHILDFLAAALYVDDATLLTEFVEWLHDLLAARNVPAVALTAGLEAVGEVVPDGERVRRFLSAARAAVDARLTRSA